MTWAMSQLVSVRCPRRKRRSIKCVCSMSHLSSLTRPIQLFAGPLNSELRRRQSTDFMNTLSSSDRQRLTHPNPAVNNTMRYGPFSARRRDSTGESVQVMALSSLTFILQRSTSTCSASQTVSFEYPRCYINIPSRRAPFSSQ